MVRTIDARGLSCPQPVILVRKAIEAGEFPIEVLVETVTSLENVRRTAEKADLRVDVEEREDDFLMVIERPS
ncbi:MAG: sulfurtransferase TusA family protein [Planctomycetes bacterium]|nr:sulfurtransferase TusA family protein [Planctomycetota bacterium]